MSWVLAVDFGTSNTTAAFADDGAAALVLEVAGSRYLPSVVVAGPDGDLLTGEAAVRQALVYPERAERVPKRALVNGGDVQLGGVPFAAPALAAAVLGTAYAEAVRLHGGTEPDVVVLTHPARWTGPLLDRLRAAADLAGIGRERQVLLSEPEAAAWFYAPPAAGQVVAVFDLGGGTLDTAVLAATRDGFAAAGQPGGNAELGGEDFDEALLGWVGDRAAERDPAAWEELSGDGRRAARDRARLRAEVTAAKEALSKHTSYAVVVDGFDEEFRVTRDDFDALIGDAVGSAVAEMTRTVAAAGVAPSQLSGLYLTGGSSRVPLIAKALWAALGIEPQLRDDPKAVVALGALKTHAAAVGASAAVGEGVAVKESAAVSENTRPRPVAGQVELSRARVLSGVAESADSNAPVFARVAWSPDGAHLVVCAGPRVGVWRVADGRKITSLAWRIWSPISALAWAPDSSTFATAQLNSGKVKIWSFNAVTRAFDIPRISKIRSIAWNSSGTLMAAAGDKGDVNVIDYSGGQLRAFVHKEPLGFFPGAAMALAKEENNTMLRFWDPPLAWQPRSGSAGELLAFGAKDGVIRGLVPASAAPKQAQVTELLRVEGLPTGLAWSPGGTELAVCHTRGMTIWWPATGAKRELTLASHTVGWPAWVQWTSDGRYVTGFHRSYMQVVTQVVGVSMWDAAGAEVKSWYRPATPAREIEPGQPIPGTIDPCQGISLSPSGASLARVWANQPPEIWDISGI